MKTKHILTRRKALKNLTMGGLGTLLISHGDFFLSACSSGDSSEGFALGSLQTGINVNSGVPQLQINNTSVRARMFWGSPESKFVKANNVGRDVAVEFVATEESLETPFYIRFMELSGNVYFDEIKITDITSEKIIFSSSNFKGENLPFVGKYSYDTEYKNVGAVSIENNCGKNGSKGLKVQLQAPPNNDKWPDFYIQLNGLLKIEQNHLYQISFWVRSDIDQKLTISKSGLGRFCFLNDDGDCFQEQVRLASEVGINIVTFHVGVPWPKDNETNPFYATDILFRSILSIKKDVLLLPRIAVVPPGWWIEKHPEEAMTWEDGSKDKRYAVPGEVFCRDACKNMELFVRHLESEFGDHIIGYQPAGQNTSEWFYKNSWFKNLNGYSKSDQREWRTYLKKKYKDDKSLIEAWQKPNISIDNAEVPSAESRHSSPFGIFRHPIEERQVVDFCEFQQDLMADCLCKLAKTIKKACDYKKIVAFFYGYVFEFSSMGTGPASSGHYAIRKVLDCPDIDMLAGPISYFDRFSGGVATTMTAAESIQLAGKMWFNEDDTRTYLAKGKYPGYENIKTLDETNQLLIRNTGQCAIRNFGTWWMDLGRTGWFNDPGMWKVMDQLKTMDNELLENPKKFNPDVAAVVDPASLIRIAEGGNVASRPAVKEVMKSLGRMGTPFGQYLLDDVMAGKVQAKLYVMQAAWYLSKEQRQELLTKLKGKVKIWCYAPGYITPEGFSLESMQELTGFQFKKVELPNTRISLSVLGKKMGLSEEFGVDKKINPLFAVTDAKEEEVLATYSDGSVAITMRKESEGGISFFVGTPGLSTEVLRFAAKKANVHLYTEDDCNIYANGQFIALHASQDGVISIDTNSDGAVYDVLTKEEVGTGPSLKLTVKMGDSRVFRLGSQ